MISGALLERLDSNDSLILSKNYTYSHCRGYGYTVTWLQLESGTTWPQAQHAFNVFHLILIVGAIFSYISLLNPYIVIQLGLDRHGND